MHFAVIIVAHFCMVAERVTPSARLYIPDSRSRILQHRTPDDGREGHSEGASILPELRIPHSAYPFSGLYNTGMVPSSRSLQYLTSCIPDSAFNGSGQTELKRGLIL